MGYQAENVLFLTGFQADAAGPGTTISNTGWCMCPPPNNEFFDDGLYFVHVWIITDKHSPRNSWNTQKFNTCCLWFNQIISLPGGESFSLSYNEKEIKWEEEAWHCRSWKEVALCWTDVLWPAICILNWNEPESPRGKSGWLKSETQGYSQGAASFREDWGVRCRTLPLTKASLLSTLKTRLYIMKFDNVHQ